MTPNFAEQAEKYTAAWDVKINDHALKSLKLSYLREKSEVQSYFLAGCEHGYRVGKADAKELCHVIATQEREISHLKARLEEVTEALEQREGVNAKSLLSQNLDLRARLEERDAEIENLKTIVEKRSEAWFQVKARLAEAEKALKPFASLPLVQPSAGIVYSVNDVTLLRSDFLRASSYFTQHPQDGAKGDL